MPKLPNEILNGKLRKDGESGDGKRAFVTDCTNDHMLRIEFDTDDTDAAWVKKWMTRIIECVNACRGISDLDAVRKLERK